jgi:hypothetical protein
MKKLKRYKTRLEFHVIDHNEVEAESEDEAERIALEQATISGVNAEHYDTEIECLDEEDEDEDDVS